MARTRVVLTFIAWNIIATHCTAHTIDCKMQHCQHTSIDCLPNEDCFVSCDDPKACLGALITCPINGDCDILCRGGESCRDSIINATLSEQGNFNLLCQESTDHCKGITILGSTQPSTDNAQHTFNVTCNGNQRACIHSQITCPLHQNCSIHCDSDTSCRWVQINGPKTAELTVHCNGAKSCFDAIFDGSQSSKLEIKGCVNGESCLDLTFHCPPNTNGQKNCFIQGNNNLGRSNSRGTEIYAINGWNDIEIDYFGSYGSSHVGTMFCSDDYGMACAFAPNAWTCVNDNDYCNFYTQDTTTLKPSNPCDTFSYRDDEEYYNDCMRGNIPTMQPSLAPSIHTTDESRSIRPTISNDSTVNTRPIYVTNGINMEVFAKNKKSQTISWTMEMVISWGLIVCALFTFLGIYYCLCIRNKRTKPDQKTQTKKTQTFKHGIRGLEHDQRMYQLNPLRYQSRKLSEYKFVKVETLDENDLKSETHTVEMCIHPVIENHNISITPSPPTTDLPPLPLSSAKLKSVQIQDLLRQLHIKKMEVFRKESMANASTSNKCIASSMEMQSRNICYLNPPSNTLSHKRKSSAARESSETSMTVSNNDTFITNTDEILLSCDTFTSPIKPVYINELNNE